MEGQGANMLVQTKYFGEIDIEEDKIIHFEHGIMGFEEYKNYTILFDADEGEKATISWLQSIDEAALALPVISPFLIKIDYNPTVDDDLLKPLGDIDEDNLLLLLSLTVPSDITKMTANLKAPFVINGNTRIGTQIIVENSDYEIKYSIFEAIQKLKKQKGDSLC